MILEFDFDYATIDGGRFTGADRERIGAGLCLRVVAYGGPGPMRPCSVELTPAERAAGQIECREHEADQAEDYGRVVRIRPQD